MRSLTALMVSIVPLLTACGLQDRLDAPEARINRVLPPDSGVQAARQRLLSQTAAQPELQRALEPMWAARLRLRALTCSRDYTPTWRESDAEVRARLVNASCFADYDRSLQRWVGLQRARLLLSEGPVRPDLQASPPVIAHREFITSMTVARDAPVVLLQGASGFDIVELSSGRSIFREQGSPITQGRMDLSPNGRLFAQANSGKVALRATEGGETLVELTPADGVIWLDRDVMALRSNGTMNLRLLDLGSGEESDIPGAGNGYAYMAARVPGSANRFNLFVHNRVDQIEIVRAGGRNEARLLAEKRTTSGHGFAINTGGMSADGAMWVDGSQSVRVLNLETLDLTELSFKPVGTQTAWPTANPAEFLLSMHLPTGDGVTSHFNYYVFNYRANTLAPVMREPSSSTRYQYIPAIKRLALIEHQNVRVIEKLQTGAAQPVDSVVAAFIDEMNQRRLAAAAAKELDGLLRAAAAGPGGARTGSEASELQNQLREAQVEGVGVYEGRGARHGGRQARVPGVVEIRVRRSSRPIALVLSSYEPVRWIIVTEPGARLSAVLVSGYYDSTVEGAGAARVYKIGQVYAYGQQSGGYSELQRIVERWSGKQMGVFQGRYEGSSFSVGGG